MLIHTSFALCLCYISLIDDEIVVHLFALRVGTFQAQSFGGVWLCGCVVSGTRSPTKWSGRLEYNHVANVNFTDWDSADYGVLYAQHGVADYHANNPGSGRTIVKSLYLK
jgi:hypothetical protein